MLLWLLAGLQLPLIEEVLLGSQGSGERGLGLCLAQRWARVGWRVVYEDEDRGVGQGVLLAEGAEEVAVGGVGPGEVEIGVGQVGEDRQGVAPVAGHAAPQVDDDDGEG